MPLTAIVGFTLVVFSVIMLIGFSLLGDRVKASFRDIPAFIQFTKALGTAVEDGTRIHFSLGSSSVASSRTAASFSAISILRRIVELSAISDKPPLATSGDAALAILSQDSLQTAYRVAGAEQKYKAASGCLTGVTPFSYAAGTLPAIYDEDISANVLAGGFGIEVGLLSDAAERTHSFILAAADSLPAQAVLYVSAQEPLIGEELFASGAYFNAGRAHLASLYTQDVLRWLIVIALIGGAVMKLVEGML